MSTPSKKVFVASRLPKNTGVSGWVAMLPPRQAKPRLEGHTTTDVVIIGGGFAGLSAARRIMELDPTLHVAVLEADTIGEAAAGRNSGLIIDLPHEVSSEDYGGDAAAKSREAIEISRTAIALADAVAQ
uniref:FAD-dependent oxidoreductase n=1 Tax=Streptomyces sp. 049-1 TaxID=2789264 RepID=UPI0039816234